MDTLDTPQLLSLAAALGFVSGIRLYAVLLIVGQVRRRRGIRGLLRRQRAGGCPVTIAQENANPWHLTHDDGTRALSALVPQAEHPIERFAPWIPAGSGLHP